MVVEIDCSRLGEMLEGGKKLRLFVKGIASSVSDNKTQDRLIGPASGHNLRVTQELSVDELSRPLTYI